MRGGDGQPHELSEVLAAELEAIRGPTFVTDTYGAIVNVTQAVATGNGVEAGEDDRRRTFYSWAHQFNLSALCLSGGGIRSASFSLGAIQGLAEAKLLSRFDYLSTVSGGGYIGSWLSAWLHWEPDGRKVLDQLLPRRALADQEPGPLQHLRGYSSYLTPKIGLISGDFWAAVAIVFRNLLLNWLILLPLIALPVIAVKLIAAAIQTSHPVPVVALVGLICLVLSGCSWGYKLRRLYLVRSAKSAAYEQPVFLMRSLVPAIAAGFCFSWIADVPRTPAGGPGWPAWLLTIGAALILYVVVAVIVYPAIVKSKARLEPQDWVAWGASAIGWGSLIWLGAYLYAALPAPYEIVRLGALCLKEVTDCVAKTAPHSVGIDRNLLLVIFGMPWFLLSVMLAQTVYTLAHSYSPAGDFEREWLGRAGGWYMLAGLGWIVLSAIVLLGPDLYYGADLLVANGHDWLTAIGAAAGTVSAFLGRSSLTSAQGSSTNWPGLTSNIVLAIAGPVFAVMLLIVLSVTLDGIAFGQNFWWSAAVIAGLIAVTVVCDFLINVNRFSLHAVYRNRLMRAYLGGPRGDKRKPDGFTGFDRNDNIRVGKLWPNGAAGRSGWRPFHVINMALNLPSTKKLAWQQRKAISFAVTPLFSGAADPALGYRKTVEYGNPDRGISLGTAMAISGAAVSPNMGYHSSPSAAFLLTLFNVRLGWWLGNPGPAGTPDPCWQRRLKRFVDPKTPKGTVKTHIANWLRSRFGEWIDKPRMPYLLDAPQLALRPLLSELFGLANEDSPYVYLSDGGHFEDLGIYEMVRRRCKWIVVLDGDADPDRGFVDLGDAVRKVWIDLGARISFHDSDLLQATRETKPENVPYFALGTIEYVSDRPIGGDTTPCGHILYIKPTVRGDEWAADVIAYKRANPAFPHQSTGDQWFDEPQLEAYRALGYLTMQRIIEALGPNELPDDLADLFSRLAQLNPTTFEPRMSLYDEA